GDIDGARRPYANGNGDAVDDGAASDDPTRPFETLYELGLLGYGDGVPDSGERIQTFRPPGHGLSEHAGRTMPESDCYFLHPVLHSPRLPQQRSRELIGGNGCPVPSGLRRPAASPAGRRDVRQDDRSGQKAEGPVRRRLAAILAADVVGYSRLM